ncbi:MMPL family transporter [uncultured Thiodictyon sp.]|jgi:predicted exporter|uniref:MMPL family transporter n=1 Tax=uncultured Thiodictyon sp. TaxID=1846217 RepID=UPI0025FFCD4E|nr:MMPL family transporter [uncultured Thiodictyon sp.]
MSRRGGVVIGLWLVVLLACLWVVLRTHFTADLSAFLPRTPTLEQQLLIDQIRSGIASRLILIGIKGGDQAARARVSRELAARLRTDAQFLHIANGEPLGLERDAQVLLENRYLLSPAMDADRFTVAGLRQGIAENIESLAAADGLFSKALLPRDPTGEFTRLLDAMGSGQRPQTLAGAWSSRDGRRALLLARTRADGADTDGQFKAVTAIRAAFAAVSEPGMTAALTGPGPFSVTARTTIRRDVLTLSGLGSLIIIGLLLLVYRSPVALLLGLLPVLSGALAAVAVVSLGFGMVHGLTLGFGTALIGEAVDYSTYLLIQSERTHGTIRNTQSDWNAAFWPTIRIGVLTSIIGFASLLFSSFPGLSQLGLFAITGLATAALVTRFVLPSLLPRGLRVRDVSASGRRLQVWVAWAGRLRGPVLVLFAAACLVLLVRHQDLWNRELAALNPVSGADQALDVAMRTDLGAPDVRYLVVVTAAEREAALATSEAVASVLHRLQAAGLIAGFESPAAYLPSQAVQRRRQASLPPDAELRQRFSAAIAELPLRPERFEPFFADVAKARGQASVRPEDLQGTSLAEGVDALLMQSEGRWSALLPLRVAAGQRLDARDLHQALAQPGLEGVYFIDLKGAGDDLYEGYLREAIVLSLAGLAAIFGLLLVATRSSARVLRIAAPLVAAVAVTIAGLVLAGQQLTILHLVGMLLVVAVGSNYALFFDQGAVAGGMAPRVLASLVLAVGTTVAGFGILAFSSVPVLNAVGCTVGPGAVLALVFSAILTRRA